MQLRLFKNRKSTTYALIFGLIFSFLNFAGKEFQDKIVLSLQDYALVFLNTLIFTLITAELYLRLQSFLLNKENKRKEMYQSGKTVLFSKNDRRYYWKCFVAMIVFYTPVFLAYFPGIFAYDVYLQVPQITGNAFSTHYPLIHTFYLKLFYEIIGEKLFHNHTVGVALGTASQMIIFAFMISYVHLFLYRVRLKKCVRFIMIVISGVVPIFSMMSISFTKDTFFGGFVAVLSVCICYWSLDSEIYRNKKILFVYCLSIIGTVIFRNNGIYPVIAMLMVGMLVFLKKKNYTFVISTFGSVLLSILLLFTMKTAVSASEGSKAEMLNIPFQQVALVYNTEYQSLSAEDKATIEEILPRVKDYSPIISDYVKGNNHYSEKFWALYCKLFLKFPMKYVEAFIQNNMGYFYLADTTDSHIYFMFGFMETGVMKNLGVAEHSIFPHLKYIYEYLFSYNNYIRTPFIWAFCSLSVYFWGIMFLSFSAIQLKRKTALLTVAFILLFLLTVVAGPCVLPRYALPYMLFIPALYVSVFSGYKQPSSPNWC